MRSALGIICLILAPLARADEAADTGRAMAGA